MTSKQFHIQLDGLPLTDAQSKSLADEIDQVVSKHLAKMDFKGDLVVTRPGHFNKEWLGIWITTKRNGVVSVPSASNLPGALHGLPQ